MAPEIKLTISRIAEIEATMANLRLAPTQQLAAAMASARSAIAPVQELAVAMANVRLNVQQMLASFQGTINIRNVWFQRWRKTGLCFPRRYGPRLRSAHSK